MYHHKSPPTHLLPFIIILHKRILAPQLLKHFFGILLCALLAVGIGHGGLHTHTPTISSENPRVAIFLAFPS